MFCRIGDEVCHRRIPPLLPPPPPLPDHRSSHVSSSLTCNSTRASLAIYFVASEIGMLYDIYEKVIEEISTLYVSVKNKVTN